MPRHLTAQQVAFPGSGLRFSVPRSERERGRRLPCFGFGAWQGVLAPAGTPRDVVRRLNGDINAILKDPEAGATLIKMGFTPVGGTPEQFQALIASSIDKWAGVVRDAKIKAD